MLNGFFILELILSLQKFQTIMLPLKKIFFLFLATITINACNPHNNNEDVHYNFQNGIFVINEGNFTFGNASLSFIDTDADTIYNNIFYKKNNYPLGDVAQSAIIFDDKLFVVVNNSGKIFVINPHTAEYIGTISDLSSPRYLQIISDTKAYISDLYSNTITIINPQTFNISSTFNVGCPVEAMLKYNDFVFALNWNKGNKLLKINTLTNKLEDSITVAFQPQSLVLDKNNNLWILSDGGYDNYHTAALTLVNPENLQIIKTFYFADSLASPTRLNINSTKDTLFFLNSSWSENIKNSGVYKMSINDSLPKTPFIPENSRLFYSLTIATNGDIIVSDAIDYQQPGKIFFYSASGKLKKTYTTDIIPGAFCELITE